MQIRTSADWRDALPFETPLLASEVVPGDPSRCARCPADAAPRERSELWVVKHKHPNNHAGFVRFYCRTHRPEAVVVAAATPQRASTRGSSSARAPRAPRPPRTPKAPERVAPVCGTCFVEVPPSGLCGVCGERVG